VKLRKKYKLCVLSSKIQNNIYTIKFPNPCKYNLSLPLTMEVFNYDHIILLSIVYHYANVVDRKPQYLVS
jgi:hypothetical protein